MTSGYKRTSLGRPSHATLYRRQLEERKDNEARAWGALIWVHRDIAADIDLRYWAAGLDGAARVFKKIGEAVDADLDQHSIMIVSMTRAERLNARADKLMRTGAQDVSEVSMWDEHLQYGH